MRIALAARLRFSSLAVLVLIGTWLGHAIEYGVVAGWRGFDLGISGPLHSYMLPAAVCLTVASFLVALRLTALARRTRRQCELLRRRLRGAVREHDSLPDRSGAAERAVEAHGLVVLAAVGAAQLCLYLIQENAEAVAAGAPAPGLGAISGVHWAAPLVHLAVASVLTLAWLAGCRLLRGRIAALAAVTAFVAAILRRLGRATAAAVPASAVAVSSWLPPARAPRAPPATRRLLTA